ncbi:MAG: HrpE/YscL family type III secretion apparatus protein [Parachlamydiaceae bacterium]|nr:HrpE/YscL family type III secretion apparatus protein [Parachlamydiaceae bacterium]
MNKKFFTLIYGDKIQAAPKAKIIPAESFSKIVEASEVLDHVKKDAEKYRHSIVDECEKIKENAHREGYEEGFGKWAEHVVRLENEIKSVRVELQKAVIPAALKAAKKIVSRELELSEDSIVDIVVSTLKSVSQHKKITIYVNRKDLEVLEKSRPRLKDIFENLEGMAIREREDITPGGCVVETEIGIINAQLEHRWQILERVFESLAKTNTAAPKKAPNVEIKENT